jgi:PKD repeat protein
VQVNISGLFSGNVTQIIYAGAGFNSTQINNNCGIGNFPTSIVGVPTSNQSILTAPPVTSTNVNGNDFGVICAYSCNINASQGGCNTIDQVVNYFTSNLGGTLNSLNVQYGCWLNSTNYALSAFAGTCCTLPALAPITNFQISDTVICAGECINLQDLSSNSPTSFNWSLVGASTSTSMEQSPQGICYNSGGTFQIELTTSNAAGSSTISKNITVLDASSTPSISISPNNTVAICQGETVNLVATAINGGSSPTFEWILNENQVVSNTNSFASSALSDGDTLLVTLVSNASCLVDSTAQQIVAIETYEVPVLSTSTQPNNCQGSLNGSANVSVVSGSPALSYNWNTFPPSTLQTVSNLSAGTYTVVVTYGNGCTISADAIVETSGITLSSSVVNPQTTISNPSGSVGISVVGGNPPYGFLWNTNPPQFTNVASGLSSGTYSCIVTDATGCSATFEFTVPSFVGLPEFKESDFIIEPNPVVDFLHINCINPINTNLSYSLIDITGKTIITQDNISQSNQIYSINVSNLSNGIYFLELKVKSIIFKKKIIKN